MLFRQWVDQVTTELKSKDPRKTKLRLSGNALFLLRDADGALQRVTICIDQDQVRVLQGTHVVDDTAPTAIVRGQVADCVAFFAGDDQNALASLQVYGDTRLFSMVAELAAVKRDMIGLRASIAKGTV